MSLVSLTSSITSPKILFYFSPQTLTEKFYNHYLEKVNEITLYQVYQDKIFNLPILKCKANMEDKIEIFNFMLCLDIDYLIYRVDSRQKYLPGSNLIIDLLNLCQKYKRKQNNNSTKLKCIFYTENDGDQKCNIDEESRFEKLDDEYLDIIVFQNEQKVLEYFNIKNQLDTIEIENNIFHIIENYC